jgi:hypothetical protein
MWMTSTLLMLAYMLLPAPPWYSMRYTVPFQLALTLAVSITLCRLLETFLAGRVILLAGITFFGIHSACHYYSMYPRPGVSSAGYISRANWARENLPEGSILGVPQSGYMSYFSGHTTINLDGVVNRQAFDARREGRMIDYILEQKINFVMDGKAMLEHMVINENPERFHAHFLHFEAPGMDVYWNPSAGGKPPQSGWALQLPEPPPGLSRK